MPSHSVKQARVMSAIAHGWHPSGLDIPVKVAKEFHAADAGHKYGKGMDKKSKALLVAKRSAKKYAEGGTTFGSTSEGVIDPKEFIKLRGYDPSADRKAVIDPADEVEGPKNQDWNSTHGKLDSGDSYAEGGDTGGTPFDWSGVGQAMPEHIGREHVVDPVANAAVSAATMYPRYVQSMVDAGNTTPGSEEAHQAYGDVGRATGEMGIGMIGSRGAAGSKGVFVGPYGAMALRNAAKETGNTAAENAMVHPVVGKELEKEVSQMPEWMRDPYRNSVQESRDDWARKTLEDRAAKGDYRDRDVFQRSGWSFTADHKPAKEISDIGAKMVPEIVQEQHIRPGKEGGWETLEMPSGRYKLEHPAGDIHKAYDIPSIDPVSKNSKASLKDADAYFQHQPMAIGVAGDPAKKTSQALHEIQHAIQYREGWPKGSNPNAIKTKLMEKEWFPGQNLPEWQKEAMRRADPKLAAPGYQEKLNSIKSTPTTAELVAYLNSAGENQSFNVQKRRAHAFNYLQHPQDTENVPRAFQNIEHRASGGAAGNFNPERGAAFGLAKQGMINSSVPGRTDKLELNVPNGSYVIPADIPSALGQGNTTAGGSILDKMFNKGPYGMNISKTKGGFHHPKLSKMKFASGGRPDHMPIVAAGGEYLVHPEAIHHLGAGDLEKGHKILDAFVKHVRSKHIKTLKGLAPPKGSSK